MALPMYADGTAKVTKQGSNFLLELGSGEDRMSIILTNHAAVSVREGIELAEKQQEPSAQILRFRCAE